MSRLRTLRARFALWTAGLLLAAMLGFSAFVYWRTARGLQESLDASLQVSAVQVVASIGGEQMNVEDGQLTLGDNLTDTAALAQFQEQGLTIRVLRSDGTILQAAGAYRDLPVDRASLQAAPTARLSSVRCRMAALLRCASIRCRSASMDNSSGWCR